MKNYDVIIVGAGPAGISASLMAKKHNLNFLTLEQDSLGGTVFTFPRTKIVMTKTNKSQITKTVTVTMAILTTIANIIKTQIQLS